MWVVYWNDQREGFHIAKSERANKRRLQIFEWGLSKEKAVSMCMELNERMMNDDR